MDLSRQHSLPTIEDASYLEALQHLPAYLWSESAPRQAHSGQFACSLCGVGTSVKLPLKQELPLEQQQTLRGTCYLDGNHQQGYPARLQGGYLQLLTQTPPARAGELKTGLLVTEQGEQTLKLRAFDLLLEPDGRTLAQRFLIHPGHLKQAAPTLEQAQPTRGCRKFRYALGERAGLYPLHLRPSVLDITGRRVPLFYEEALERFADLVLDHRPPRARTLLYASGQLDYFAVFAMQEVFRLLGVRNMTSNGEHGYLSGGVYRSLLAGEPGPFVTIPQALEAPQGFYLLNGWNGAVTHPPVFEALLEKPDLDAYLVDVMMSESARALAARLGSDRVLIIRSGGDSHLAMAVAHVLLKNYPEAVEMRFVEHFAEPESFERFAAQASADSFRPEEVAERIAPEFKYRKRIAQAIEDMARKLAAPGTVPVHIPSMGFSQTRGVVPHCLWANILALTGKFGLHPNGSLAGGVLQLAGQANHETHLQSLSPQHFMGRIPVNEAGAAEAAARLGLTAEAYDKVLQITPRLALDFSEPDPRKELFVFFGSHFAASMMNRSRWLSKLKARQTQFVVIDPAPDAFALKYAALILPAAPHVASAKLFQNGEWRLSLSLPRRKAPSQTRSDATIIYDLMATISRMLSQQPSLWLQHPDLAQLIRQGYLQQRFEPSGLPREEGEVSRAVLWARIQDYFSGTQGNGLPLFCRPEHADGQAVSWDDLLTQGNLVHGGVGSTRQRLDYDQPEQLPFSNLYREPVRYRFFVPSEADLDIPRGIILSTGRAALQDPDTPPEQDVTRTSFNFSRLSTSQELPAENPLFVSHMLAERYNLNEGDRVWVTNRDTRSAMVLKVQPTSRLKGETVYLSIYKNQAELEQQRDPNLLTSHRIRCPYTGQTGHKLTRVELQRLQD